MAAILGRSITAQIVLFALFALLVRGSVFGEWTYDIDEQYYFLVGERLLHGDLLYVDMWDRKGPFLYLLYALFALISRSILSYQSAATLSVVISAYGISRLTQLVSSPLAGVLAGINYIALSCFFGGASGESPVFYNTLMIAAAWTIASKSSQIRAGQTGWTIAAGIACASAAVAIKQTAIFEAAFFGFYIAVQLWRSSARRGRVIRQVALLTLIGLAPWIATATFYAIHGHFAELWQALVSSSSMRTYFPSHERLLRMVILPSQLIFPLIFAALGWRILAAGKIRSQEVTFLALWTLVAFVAVYAFPNIYKYYALTVLPPLCVLSSVRFLRDQVGKLACVAMLLISLGMGGTLDLPRRLRAHAVADQLYQYVLAETPNRKLFVFGMPLYLYMELGARPPGPLAFPPHLYELNESGASGIDEVAQVKKILAARPETVVVQNPILADPVNKATLDLVRTYLHSCRDRRRFLTVNREGPSSQDVYSRCGTIPQPIRKLSKFQP